MAAAEGLIPCAGSGAGTASAHDLVRILREDTLGNLSLCAAGATDAGRERSLNEDAFLVRVSTQSGRPPTALLIVADGMGGHASGEVASQIVVRTLRQRLGPLLDEEHSGSPIGAGVQSKATRRLEGAATVRLVENVLEEVVRSAIAEAHAALRAEGERAPGRSGLGSTLALAVVVGDRLLAANVGDSRIYLLRGRGLEQISRDHSLVGSLVEAGQITRAQVYDHPNRNLIYRSLGAGNEADPEMRSVQLDAGETVLLCSDGLWEMVRDDEIAAVLAQEPLPQGAAVRLVELANAHGGADNIAAVVLRANG